jgi:uncharacterized membrane protein YtjA (UPF0391 family)
MPRRSALREDTLAQPSPRFRRRPITPLQNSAPVDGGNGRCSVACAAAGLLTAVFAVVLVVFLYSYVTAMLRPSSLPLSRVLLWSAAAATVAVYALYTVAARDQSELSATVPFVALGVARYLYLVHRDDLGEEPEKGAAPGHAHTPLG